MAEEDKILHTPIKDKKDVINFFDYLYLTRSISFHPDDDFNDYVNTKTKEPSFTKAEAEELNKRMKEAFDVLGDDIYEVGIERLEKHYPHLVQKNAGGKVQAKPALQFKDGGNLREIPLPEKRHGQTAALIKQFLAEHPGRKVLIYDVNGDYETEPKSIRTYKTGGGLCPVGTEVQTLIFNKEVFTRPQAIAWAKEHDYNFSVDETTNSWRLRQQEPNKFHEDSFRTIIFRRGLKAVIACPKNKR